MKLAQDQLQAWLDVPTRVALERKVRASRSEISLPQAQAVVDRLNSLQPARDTLRIGIVRSYTSEPLEPWLNFEAAQQGMNCDLYQAPYGVTVQEAGPESGLQRHEPDVTVLLLRLEDIHPALRQPLAALDRPQQQELLIEVASQVCELTARFREKIGGIIVVTILPAFAPPALGIFDSLSDRSEAAWRSSLKSEICKAFRDELRSTLFLDLDDVVAGIGRDRFFDLKFWYASRFPFSAVGAREIARRLAAVGAAVKLPRAKVIALDADNTMWGGVVGEDGPDGVAIGPDYPGNAFVAFQRRLLDLRQRGFILVLCSKNNPADVDEILDKHPHQLLRKHHFAAMRVNWDSKSRNLRALADELNLGLNSFILVDDSDHECSAVLHELPEVEVIQTPGKPVDVPACLDRVARLEIVALTAEDQAKSALYAQERQRRALELQVSRQGGDPSAYLETLEMKMTIGLDDRSRVARIAQLTQKTNQFNLTTRRYSEQRIQELIDSPQWLVAHFSLEDIFGDSGLVGVALIRNTGDGTAEIDSYLMSCRVIGRQAEAAFLEALGRHLAANGIERIFAEYLPTSKNVLAKDFLMQHGFSVTPDGRYCRSLSDRPPQPESAFPIHVVLDAARTARAQPTVDR